MKEKKRRNRSKKKEEEEENKRADERGRGILAFSSLSLVFLLLHLLFVLGSYSCFFFFLCSYFFSSLAFLGSVWNFFELTSLSYITKRKSTSFSLASRRRKGPVLVHMHREGNGMKERERRPPRIQITVAFAPASHIRCTGTWKASLFLYVSFVSFEKKTGNYLCREEGKKIEAFTFGPFVWIEW